MDTKQLMSAIKQQTWWATYVRTNPEVILSQEPALFSKQSLLYVYLRDVVHPPILKCEIWFWPTPCETHPTRALDPSVEDCAARSELGDGSVWIWLLVVMWEPQTCVVADIRKNFGQQNTFPGLTCSLHGLADVGLFWAIHRFALKHSHTKSWMNVIWPFQWLLWRNLDRCQKEASTHVCTFGKHFRRMTAWHVMSVIVNCHLCDHSGPSWITLQRTSHHRATRTMWHCQFTPQMAQDPKYPQTHAHGCFSK